MTQATILMLQECEPYHTRIGIANGRDGTVVS